MTQDRAAPYLHHPQEMMAPLPADDDAVLARFISSARQFVSVGTYLLDKVPEIGDEVLVTAEGFGFGLVFRVEVVETKFDRVYADDVYALEGTPYYLCDLSYVRVAD